jgi:hypothetical protein
MDSFTYTTADRDGSESSATVSVIIHSNNDPPIAANDAFAVSEDFPLNVFAPGVLSNDTDADGDVLTAELVTGPTRGTLALQPNGAFTYTPAADFHGPDSFTYRANDGADLSNVATVTLNVLLVNDAPIAAADFSAAASSSASAWVCRSSAGRSCTARPSTPNRRRIRSRPSPRRSRTVAPMRRP